MKHCTWSLALLVLIAVCNIAESRTIEKRQIKQDASLQPEHQANEHDHIDWRDKRKIEAKWGIKNALLGFVFNKINSWIDKKTHWVAQLDKTNIAKNKAQGIESPKDPAVSLTHLITEKVGQKLQAAGPLIGVIVQKVTSGSGGLLGGASGGGGGSAHAGAGTSSSAGHSVSGSAGFDFGSLIGSLSSAKGFGGLSGGISGHGGSSYGR